MLMGRNKFHGTFSPSRTSFEPCETPAKLRKRKSRAKPRPFVRELIAHDEMSFRRLVIQFTGSDAPRTLDQSCCPDGAVSTSLCSSFCTGHGGVFSVHLNGSPIGESTSTRNPNTLSSSRTGSVETLHRQIDRTSGVRRAAYSSPLGRSFKPSKVLQRPRRRKSRAKPKPFIRELIAKDHLNFKKLVHQITGAPAEVERSNNSDVDALTVEVHSGKQSSNEQKRFAVKHDLSENKTMDSNACTAEALRTIESISTCMLYWSSNAQPSAALYPKRENCRSIILAEAQTPRR